MFGLSNNTVRSYASEHPGLDCDVVFVDGAKFTEQRLLDLQRFRSWSHHGGVLFYDEATSIECVNGTVGERHKLCQGNDGASKAYNRAVKTGLVKVVDCRWPDNFRPSDGSCVAEYL